MGPSTQPTTHPPVSQSVCILVALDQRQSLGYSPSHSPGCSSDEPINELFFLLNAVRLKSLMLQAYCVVVPMWKEFRPSVWSGISSYYEANKCEKKADYPMGEDYPARVMFLPCTRRYLQQFTSAQETIALFRSPAVNFECLARLHLWTLIQVQSHNGTFPSHFHHRPLIYLSCLESLPVLLVSQVLLARSHTELQPVQMHPLLCKRAVGASSAAHGQCKTL